MQTWRNSVFVDESFAVSAIVIAVSMLQTLERLMNNPVHLREKFVSGLCFDSGPPALCTELSQFKSKYQKEKNLDLVYDMYQGNSLVENWCVKLETHSLNPIPNTNFSFKYISC